MQVAKPGKGISDITWEHFQINPATINRMQEIEQILKDNELLIGDWAPIHLSKLLKTWFWKDDTQAVGALDQMCIRDRYSTDSRHGWYHRIAAGAHRGDRWHPLIAQPALSLIHI